MFSYLHIIIFSYFSNNFFLCNLGILVDIHVHYWVNWLDWILDSHLQEAKVIWDKLETYFPKLYWEMINMVCGCLGQILANETILSKAPIMGFVNVSNPAYIDAFDKAYV